MRLHRWSILSVLLLAVILLAACTTPKIELRQNDRIIFLGGSFTPENDQSAGFVDIVRDSLLARYPDLNLEVISIGGQDYKVTDLEDHLSQDVLTLQPTIVFIFIGVNDVWHSTLAQGGTPADRYESDLRSIIVRITGSGARAVLCTPSIIGEKMDGFNPLDPLLNEYTEISRQVAHELGIPLVDLRIAFLEHLERHNQDNRESGILTTDGVHLNGDGNRLAAVQTLSALDDRQGVTCYICHGQTQSRVSSFGGVLGN